ncbi:MAG: photosynthetic protein synthase I [Gammaproteobacteria bacterium]|nr:photosynthetic protein synthase I [Gammaproteobacteria bacterium]
MAWATSGRARTSCALLWSAFLFLVPAHVTHADTGSGILALGYGPLEYELPEPGSYGLPPLGAARDAQVLDEENRRIRLHDLYDGRIVLLNFMFSRCSDINGCPLSSYVFNRLKSTMQDDPELEAGLRLVSLSLDPERDTPEVMKLYGNNFRFAGTRGDWDFVTTDSEETLKPILDAYGQDMQKLVDAKTGETLDISHLLKVFLIDPDRKIRNIYSVSFLHADLLLNDIRSLFLEADGKGAVPALARSGSVLSRPGDDKEGYESEDYVTDSLALTDRKGEGFDLLGLAESPPLGLPPIPEPPDNILSREKIELGRKLFYDRRLSINDTFSCAMCHIPEQGFSNNEMATAVGVEGRSVRRNAPTLYNVAYMEKLFHDGREENLEQQIWAPFLDRNEMANPSVGYLLGKIRSFADYEGMFEEAFDGRPIGMETLGMAITSYERTLLSANSPFDRWFYGKDETALDDAARRGFSLFTGKAGCSSCHLVNRDHALFTDHRLHNAGLGFENSIGDAFKPSRVTLAPGVFLDVDPEVMASVGEKPPGDVGLYEITEDPADRWKFRTPTLRNVALTAPYMHNGQFSTLEEVVEFYNRGGVDHELLSPLIRPLGLDAGEQEDLVAFLHALTGDNVDALVLDAFAAPVGDPGQNSGRDP